MSGAEQDHQPSISTMPVQHAEHRTITTNNCTSPVRVQQHCRTWRHLVRHATSCPEHIVVDDCRRRKRLGQPGEPGSVGSRSPPPGSEEEERNAIRYGRNAIASVLTPHSQPRALRHTTVLSNIMSL